MIEKEIGPLLIDEVINELAWRTLNRSDYQPASTKVAIYDLGDYVRTAGLGITLGLLAIANAIRETQEESE